MSAPDIPILRVIPKAPALSDYTDDDLMLLARGGHSAAFNALVKRHQSKAMQIAIRHLGSLQLAEDAVQDAFIEVHRCLSNYQPRGKFRVFFYRIVLSRARMAHRSFRRARLLLVAPPDRAEPAIAEHELLLQERRREIHRAISRLPERYRAVVTLKFGGDLSYAEISETLDIPVGTIKSRMFTALAKLRSRLGGIERRYV